ncbi:hypothetical protein A1O3_06003 [Capronia epimyces CBS 606.96]|uniref:Uncharacterized protein n=1 Tax=Capronia epimyces CBS 606.96 TaxID=1182542 RepID=W9XXT9_9EURO|nr:uncharacterized protein A1O3_06003 [Capronia epimyces CBS 606.96]EXJ82190.1 hypothetical protein A1O3_06003 [Capronia epimyces CBS 606.96]
MNTFKLHQGRLENLDDITGYRDYDEAILPLPEATINAAVRDAVYMPLPCLSSRRSPTCSASAPRALRPKPSTSFQGMTGTSETGHCFRLGLRAHKDWQTLLLPAEDRPLDMEKLSAEIQRLEASCRRRKKERQTIQTCDREWAGQKTKIPGITVWHMADVQDVTQAMEIDTPGYDGRSVQTTTPTAQSAQGYVDGEVQPDPLPGFHCFLQRTFAGLQPDGGASGSGPMDLDEGSPEVYYGWADARRFPGPLKSRHELDALHAHIQAAPARAFEF